MDCGAKRYVFQWCIENYSFCWHENGDGLASPEFTTDSLEGIIWYLEVCPRGNGYEDYISLYLCRSKYDNGPEEYSVNYRLSVLGADGSSFACKEDKKTFQKENGYGSSSFLEMNEVLTAEKVNHLAQDTLIVCCTIWTDTEKRQPTKEIYARTRIGIEHVSFYHIINDFSYLEPNEKKKMHVRCPSKTEQALSSSLFFNDRSCCGEKIILEIVPSHTNHILSKCKFSLLNGSGKLIPCGEADRRFDSSGKDIKELPLTLTRQKILNSKSTYLPNDKLSLLCECVFSTGVDYEKVEKIVCGKCSAELNRVNNSVINEDTYSEQLSACASALDDLKSSFDNQFLTDVELKTETKSFPAHKVVLCSRSSVFKAMLGNDMKEKSTSLIQIDDLNNDILQKLLIFLYSDVLEHLDWDSAIKLYYAGDKYAIEKLKLQCSSFLVKNLNTSTVAELLLLADTHNDSDLKKNVVDFTLKHEEQVYGSDEWGNLIKTNPILVSETMRQKYTKKK